MVTALVRPGVPRAAGGGIAVLQSTLRRGLRIDAQPRGRSTRRSSVADRIFEGPECLTMIWVKPFGGGRPPV